MVWKDLESFEWIKTALTQRHDMMGVCLWLIPKEIIVKSGGWDETLTFNNDFERGMIQDNIAIVSEELKILNEKSKYFADRKRRYEEYQVEDYVYICK